MAKDAPTSTDVEKKDDTPVLEKPNTWKALAISMAMNILYLFCFAIIMSNFIYFKTLNDDQLDYMFPTMTEAGKQEGGGKLYCDEYPAKWAPKWTQEEAKSSLKGPLWDSRWPTNETYEEWKTTEPGYLWGTGFTSWLKKSSILSYNTLRGWLKAFLGSGFNKSSPSIWNNMFFQSFLFFIMTLLSGILSIIVTFVHGVIVDPFFGIFLWWILLIPIPILQNVQLFGTFPPIPLPGMGFAADSKLNGLKTIKKILECNIPTLIFLFSLFTILTFGGMAGGTIAAGMWVWFIYASTRRKKKSTE